MLRLLSIVFALLVAVADTSGAAPPPQAPPRHDGRPARAAAGASALIALQVALDRAHFSPGEIDGKRGANTTRALAAFRAAKGLPGKAGATTLDATVRKALQPWFDQPVTDYVLREADVAGPFAPVPSDIMAQAKLPALGYASALELIAERFHAAPAVITALNPGARFVAGQKLRVPNVEPMVLPTTSGPLPGPGDDDQTETVIEVTESDGLLRVRRDDALLFVAPVTVGSAHDPLPVGDWMVIDVFVNPLFNYNPDLFWDADQGHAKARIAAGPNNPVGLVWIALDKEHYGIHGAPSPHTIGHTQSHGCIRLTNWDALTVAGLVRRGAAVVLR